MYPPASMTAASCESEERGGSGAGAPTSPPGMGAAKAGATWWWAGASAGRCSTMELWVSGAVVYAAVGAPPRA